MTNQKTLTLTHQFLNNLSTSTREMLIEATNNPPTQNPFQTISDFDLKQKAVAELKSNGLSFRKCSYDKKYYLRKAPATNHAVSTLHNDIFECENIIVSIYNELKKETLSEQQCKEMAAEDLFYAAIYSLKTLFRIVKQNGHDSAARKLVDAMDSIDDIWENDLHDARWEGLNKEMIQAPAPAPVEEEAQHYAIVQRSSDTILVVGESAADAVREYSVEYEEATKAELTGNWHSDQNVILVPCSEFLYTKALAGDDIIYFWDEGHLNCHITEVEDFDRADTALSSEYDENSHNTMFDSYSYPVFNLKQYLLEVASDYDSLLDYDDVSSVSNDIEAHFSIHASAEYDTVVFASCTNSNQYPDGEFKLDGEDRYCLSFDHSDAVLILRKS